MSHASTAGLERRFGRRYGLQVVVYTIRVKKRERGMLSDAGGYGDWSRIDAAMFRRGFSFPFLFSGVVVF